MILSLIVAAAENHVVGREKKLPWHISDDLKRFRRLTTGHPVIMGRKTYDSIGRLLPGRTNIIITRNALLTVSGAVMVGSLEEALSPYRQSGEEVFVIGGGEIFRQALPQAERVYLTRIHQSVEGDVHFELNGLESFEITHQESHREAPLPYSFIDYVRIK